MALPTYDALDRPDESGLPLAWHLCIVLGERFDFDALAEDSAATGNYATFFTSSPLNARGGTEAPPNAMAIR